MDYWYWGDSAEWLDEKTEVNEIKKEEPKNKFGTNSCTYHLWRSYKGLREVYEYCQYCNAKKP